MRPAVDTPEIERAIRLLVEPNATYEIRAIATTKYGTGEEIRSGYFRGVTAPAVVAHADTRDVQGCYITLNPVDPALHARRADRIARVGKDDTTKDHHITRRTRLLMDVDPDRVTKISSSDAEHRASLDLAAEIEHELRERGWPDPIRADSGNGGHLVYAIDLPTDDGGLVERVLAAANARWGCEVDGVKLKIDETNHNPARITKLYGTIARKGDNVAERPHRMSCVLSAPESLQAVTREQLEAFVAEYLPKPEPKVRKPTSTGSNGASKAAPRLDLAAWLARYSIGVKTSGPYAGKGGTGTIFELEQCPSDPDHNRGEAYVIQWDSGALAAGCHHNGCKTKGWDWKWLREHYEGPKDERYRATEIDNARRLARMHGHRLRYVQPWKRWLAWDGKRWCRDDVGVEMIAAKEVADSLFVEAAAVIAAAGGDEDKAKKGESMLKWARASSKAAALRAMLSLAQSEDPIAAAPDMFDRDPFVLNVLNGTIDLRSGQLHPHRQTDMLTRLAPVEYNPKASCPQWDKFLARVLPDEDVRTFVQRFIGYALTGDVGEQLLAFMYGLGANGKSVLLDVILALLGDYGCRAAPDLVLAKQGEAHPTEVADLEGRRMVVCSEIEQGRAWAESLIKRVTGDTTIKARHMKQDFYEFRATHKLVIAANIRPTVRGTDEAIWRRMRLVPFDVTIPPAERDRGLVARLVATESRGILAWAVAGCLAWQRDGLGAPAAIDKATADYREEQDLLGLWIAEECVVVPGVFASTTALYGSYSAWCERTGRHAWSREAMRARLVGRPGIATKNTNTARGFEGIGLVARQPEDSRVQS